jgi:hypothetical protein
VRECDLLDVADGARGLQHSFVSNLSRAKIVSRKRNESGQPLDTDDQI